MICTVRIYILLNLQIVYNGGCKCVNVIACRILLNGCVQRQQQRGGCRLLMCVI